MSKQKLFMLLIIGMHIVAASGCDDGQSKEPEGRTFQIQEKPSTEFPKQITSKDGVIMALIPAGEFQMGSDDGGDDEKTVHTVYLDAFYLDIYEVTNKLYREFIEATGYRPPGHWDDTKLNAPNQPVVGVSWQDAMAYCEWAGKRLPTEAEWEKAGRSRLVGKRYPWGDSINHDDANYCDTDGKDRMEYTAPPGSFAPNLYGLYDMAGNVWEWCADWYDKGYYTASPRRNPMGPSSGKYRVCRGGSWAREPSYLRVAKRRYSNPRRAAMCIGFRCAQDVKPGLGSF